MYLMIDNYDSFVYNLKAYFEELGKEIAVIRCDKITLEEIEDMQPSGIILSPGPKRPQDATLCIDIVEKFQEKIPILGVCLGHQVLGLCSGATVEKGIFPIHGKISEISNNGLRLFAGLPTKFNVTRYHSLVVNKALFPITTASMPQPRTVLSWGSLIKRFHYTAYSFTRRQYVPNMDMHF